MLKLRNISKRYAQKWVLRGVSASFLPGTLTLLAGANGSGKTTLLKIVAGLLKPTSGTVEGMSSDLRVAYVAHQTFLYPGLTAYENLNFWNACYGLGKTEDEIFDLLESMGLGDVADAFPKTFSRGMCQRLNLARAKLLDPSVVLLDEPMTGLDTETQDRVREDLLLLKAKGVCIVFISHDIPLDAPLADAILVLANGTLSKREVTACSG